MPVGGRRGACTASGGTGAGELVRVARLQGEDADVPNSLAGGRQGSYAAVKGDPITTLAFR